MSDFPKGAPTDRAVDVYEELTAVVDGPSAERLFAAVLQRAETVGVTLRPPPPAPTTCCGRGCNGCVWEGYLHAVEYWRQEALLQLMP